MDTGVESDVLEVETTQFPPASPLAPFWWGDVVGVLAFHCNADIREATCASPADCGGDPCERAWELPDGHRDDNQECSIDTCTANNECQYAPVAAGTSRCRLIGVGSRRYGETSAMMLRNGGRGVDFWLEELNPAQREAVTFGDGPLLVIAGAGTGKTRTLACRVAYLLERGVEPGRILLLTFTRRAAAQMTRRAGQLSGTGAGRSVWSGTFHAVANRLLRQYGPSIGLARNFTVMDQSDAADLMNLIRNDLGVAKGDRQFPRKATLVKVYSHTVNAQRPLAKVVARHFPWCGDDLEGMAAIFDAYLRRKAQRHLLDFDDLLLNWAALCDAPDVGAAVADRFDHILVDEYQDTNAVQARILRGMRKEYENIMVVGDDAQSIYSFRAATVRNILDFPKHFPGTCVVTLEENYRSTGPILAAANAVMEQASERFTKNLWSRRASEQRPILVCCMDESEQTDLVCRNVVAHLEQGIPLMEQAVLFRAGHHSAMLEIELTTRNIPFRKYGGLKFLETAHLKDLLALLRILENPFDEVSWFRVLQLLPGIGPKTARNIMDAIGVGQHPPAITAPTGKASVGSLSPVRCLITAPPPVPPAARESFAGLRRAFADCTGKILPDQPGYREIGETDPAATKVRLPVAAQVERMTRFYKPMCERNYENAAVRIKDVEQLSLIAGRFRSRRQFITDLTIDPPATTSDWAQRPHLDEDYLTLSTIHSAKGCEWAAVHIIHAADGMIPSDMAVEDQDGIDEERRLFYVALTRAKDALFVYHPLRYYHRRYVDGDGHGYSQLTRFLSDPTKGFFEQRVVIDQDVDSELADPPGGVMLEHHRRFLKYLPSATTSTDDE